MNREVIRHIASRHSMAPRGYVDAEGNLRVTSFDIVGVSSLGKEQQ